MATAPAHSLEVLAEALRVRVELPVLKSAAKLQLSLAPQRLHLVAEEAGYVQLLMAAILLDHCESVLHTQRFLHRRLKYHVSIRIRSPACAFVPIESSCHPPYAPPSSLWDHVVIHPTHRT
eukprot:6194842-Pleurochrysis_carterae.AAC.3